MAGLGIPRLAEKLEHLFATVPREGGRQLYTNDSAAEALDQLGITVSGTHLSHLRSGRRDNPSARLVAGLAQLFGVPIAYFFNDAEEQAINEQLEALSALRDSGVKGLMLRAHGVSEKSLSHLAGILEQIRQLEGLDTGDDREDAPT
ncbi:MAG: XRE family transcriptional regulator [Nocardioides sp.]